MSYMSKKNIGIVVAILIAIPVIWFLASPLFINNRVDEDMNDLLQLAGKPMQAQPSQPPVMMDPSTFVPPAGVDPKTESKGPTAPPPTPASPEESIRGVGQGTFEGLAGHSAEGTASLVMIDGAFFVRLENDFRVTNGPDLFVGFGKNGEYDKNAQIAPLKGNEGGQNYAVPSEINAAQYNEVWIWCRAFSVPFAKAQLN